MTEAEDQHPWYRDADRLMAELRTAHAGEHPTPTISGYSDLHEIGRGGQGIVYRGQQSSTGQAVAIKVIREPQPDAEHRTRFLREVSIATSLAHPGLVKVIDRGEASDGRLYLAMEMIEGEPFDEFASRQSVDGVIATMLLVADAVQHAHQRGVIHRDLKPSNIRIDSEGRPHVLDFGLAKPLTGGTATDLVSRTGLFLGSLPWASPEQLGNNPAAVDVRTDVYALGLMLYEALCQSPPYPTNGGVRETIQHLTSTPPARPTRDGKALAPDLTAIILHCLEKDPVRRYQSTSELSRDLARFLAAEPVSVQAPKSSYLIKTWIRRHRSITAAMAVLLLGTLVAGSSLWFLYTRSVRAESEARFAADKFAAVNEYLLGAILTTPEDGQQQVALAVRKAAAGVETNPTLADPLFRAETHNAVAYWLSSIGDKKNAWQHHEEAMKLRAPIMDPRHADMTSHYTTLAYFRQLHGDHAGTIDMMKHALLNLKDEEAPRQSTVAWIHRVIGESQLRLGQLDAAETSLRQSLAIEEGVREPGATQLKECHALLTELSQLR